MRSHLLNLVECLSNNYCSIKLFGIWTKNGGTLHYNRPNQFPVFISSIYLLYDIQIIIILYTYILSNIQFTYDKTFREHDGARAGQHLETKVKRVYENVLQKSYRCYVGACGVLLACLWGIINGCVAFIQTWYISPCLRVFMVLFKGLLPLITEPIRICSGACCAHKGGAGSTFDPRNMTLKY